MSSKCSPSESQPVSLAPVEAIIRSVETRRKHYDTNTLGIIEVAGERAVTWSRITFEEGWEHGFMRGVELHEHLGRCVRIIRYGGGRYVPVCDLVTEEGYLRVRPAK